MTVLETHAEYVVIGYSPDGSGQRPPVTSRLPITQWDVELYPDTDQENVTEVTFDGSGKREMPLIVEVFHLSKFGNHLRCFMVDLRLDLPVVIMLLNVRNPRVSYKVPSYI